MVGGKNLQGGFTLLEMTISMALLVIAIGVAWSAFDEAAAESRRSLTLSATEAKARGLLQRICDEVANSGCEIDGTEHVLSHPRTNGATSDFLIFEPRLDVAGDAEDWGGRIDFYLAPSGGEDPTNAIDDDGDGLIDEQRLVRQENAIDVTIADGVLVWTVARVAGDDHLEFRIVIGEADPNDGDPLVAAHTTQIALRNVPLGQ